MKKINLLSLFLAIFMFSQALPPQKNNNKGKNQQQNQPKKEKKDDDDDDKNDKNDKDDKDDIKNGTKDSKNNKGNHYGWDTTKHAKNYPSNKGTMRADSIKLLKQNYKPEKYKKGQQNKKSKNNETNGK